MSQQQFDSEVMRELEEAEYAKREADMQFQRELAAKWPGVLLWPGKQKSPVPPNRTEPC